MKHIVLGIFIYVTCGFLAYGINSNDRTITGDRVEVRDGVGGNVIGSLSTGNGGFDLILPTSTGSANQCIKNTGTPGTLTFGACLETDSDELSKVSANDTTAGYLNGKLVAGTNITLVENNDGANETLTINSTSSGLNIGDAIGNSPDTFGFLYADGGSNLGNDDSYTFSGTGPTAVQQKIGDTGTDLLARLKIDGIDDAIVDLDCTAASCESQIILTDQTATGRIKMADTGSFQIEADAGDVNLEATGSSNNVVIRGQSNLEIVGKSIDGQDTIIDITDTANINTDLGMKTTSFSSRGLDVFYRNDVTDSYIDAKGTSNELIFQTNSTNRMVIEDNGEVGINTVNPGGLFHVVGASTTPYAYPANTMAGFQSSATVSTDARIFVTSGTSGEAQIDFGNTSNASSGRIEYDNSLQRLEFATNGVATDMYVDSAGDLYVQSQLSVGLGTVGSDTLASRIVSGNNANATLVGQNTAGTSTFYVLGTGQIYSTSTSIILISDKRHKRNIRDLNYGLGEIIQLEPKRFKWKSGFSDSKDNQLGFVAQDVRAVMPELVTKTDRIDADPTSEDAEVKKTLGLKTGELIPVLVNAIKELKAEVDTLKARVDALENN